jgi:single-strand binding protein
MLNSVNLIGRMGQEPETKTLQEGQMVTKFSLATDSSYKNKAGEKVTQTEWHKVTAWGKLAEIISTYCSKGKLIYIGGKIHYDSYTDKDGVKKYTTEIVADTMKMLDSKGDGQKSAAPQHESRPDPAGDDIPF